MSDEREQKNSVFTSTQNIPTQSFSDKIKSDFGFEIPVETVPLPSSGKVYPANSSLHLVETVDIKAMSSKEEDILTSKVYLKKGTVISELIKSCLTDKSINPVDLLTGDRNALMVSIRITGYGAEYNAETVCSECDHKSDKVFDLASLPIKRLSIDPVAPGMNLFEFVLPVSKLPVKFRFMTGRDEEDIVATNDKQKKLGLQVAETNVTTSLLHSIVSVAGNEDRGKIANFVKGMPARDSLELRTYIKNNEPGLVMKQEIECDSCGHIESVGMPIGLGFFWPGTE